MGLTAASTGIKSIDSGLKIVKDDPAQKVIALSGNPNVGKSTVFNALTGMNQHTGNWPGKTVTNAQGKCSNGGVDYIMVDIPGTYSLMAHSAEEEVARDFICFGEPDVVIVVCDATCLERNLNLVLQTCEITRNVIVCVNLMDEAKKKHIKIDLDILSENLGVPVIATSARSGKGLDRLMECVSALPQNQPDPVRVRYIREIEDAIAILEPAVKERLGERLNSRWIALKLIDYDQSLVKALNSCLGYDITKEKRIEEKITEARTRLSEAGICGDILRDRMVSCVVLAAEDACNGAVTYETADCNSRDRKIDRVLTSKWTGLPIMILMLAAVFWLTIIGANYPSQLLSDFLFQGQDILMDFLARLHAPQWLCEMLALGVYRVLAWVVSVMLPPMAIFFPLFTLLEDSGYLPRIAFNLDKYFKKAHACGKQALTMCMGFGCNAAGIVGCRIIDSPRERLIAMITNNFVPCNGRYPTLIAIISMFFIGGAVGAGASVLSTVILTAVILLGVLMTFLISRLLSATILRGMPSSFTLELPPYRRPQIGKVIVRSIMDRTLFVLGRSVAVAAPAGMLIWILANVHNEGQSLLMLCASFLDPFAHLLGLDGVILIAFILGFPANEIVVPIIIMAYLSTGSILELGSFTELHDLLVQNGWTWLTAVCTMLFSLMHWPCSTTCLTIRKETQSLKWTLISFLVPTCVGGVICFIVAGTARLLGVA